MSRFCLVVLCFAVIASIDGRAVNESNVPTPKGGEVQAKVAVPAAVAQTTKPVKPISFDDRIGIDGGGNCPSGYVKSGTFCFPEDDY